MDPYLAASRDAYRKSLKEGGELLEGLSSDMLNWRPPEGGWSVAQCIAHLNTTNESYSASIAVAVDEARRLGWLARTPFKPGWLDRKFVESMEPPPKRKFKAPAVFTPEMSNLDSSELRKRWIATHQQLLDLVERADQLDLKRAKVKSPASRLLRLSLGAAFALMAAHDRRHLWQAKELLNVSGMSRSASRA